MTKAAEAYFHFGRISLSEYELGLLGETLSTIAAQTAALRYPLDTEVEVRLESGSLKGKITYAVVSLNIAYGFVANYKGFKESVPEMIADAQYVTSTIIEQAKKLPEVKGATVVRTERRTKTPGKIRRYIKHREWISAHRRQLNPSMIEIEIKKLKKLENEILEDLDDKDKKIIQEVMNDTDLPISEPEQPRVASPRKEQSATIDFFQIERLETEHADYFRRFRIEDLLDPDATNQNIVKRR